jgi:hypothetical protein
MTFTANIVRSNFVGIDASTITTGTLPVSRGGTGVSNSTGSGNVVLSDGPVLSNVNVMTLSPGSAAAPSLAFHGNTSTGIYLANTDTVGFVSGGVERAQVNTNGLTIRSGFLKTQIPACSVRSTSAQTIPVWSASIKIDYNVTPVSNQYQLYNTTTKRIEPPVNGLYYINASLHVQNTTEERYVYLAITKNVSNAATITETVQSSNRLALGSISFHTMATGVFPIVQATCIAELSTTDYVEVFASADKSTAKYISTTDSGSVLTAYLITAL